MSDSMMDLKFVGIVKFDFCPETEGEELEETLTEIYGDSGEDRGGAILGGGGWARTIFGNGSSNRIEEGTGFRWVRTSVEQQISGIYDIVTAAILSAEQLEKVLNADHNQASGLLSDYRGIISENLEGMPSVVRPIGAEDPFITYLEPEQRLEVTDEKGNIDMEQIHDILLENQGLLSRFDFPVSGLMSFVSTEDFVAPSVLMQPWGRLCILNQSSTWELPPPEDMVLGPVWLDRIRTLLPYRRAHSWSQHRIVELREYDEQVAQQRPKLKDQASPDSGIDEVLDFGTAFEELRLDWTELHTRVNDEIRELNDIFEERTVEPDEQALITFDTPIPTPEPAVFVTPSRENNSLISWYEDSVRSLLNTLESESERIEKKQRTIAEYVNEVISVKATKENIALQNRIWWLTWVLVGLTIALVILTVLLLIPEYTQI